MHNCLIIDDEELARTLISSYINKVDFLHLVESFDSPVTALKTLKTEDIDLIFLDIQMPELKGTDFAKMIPSGIKIIFTTAYSEYALTGYELNALDYLLKPITFERFLTAVNKLELKGNNENTEVLNIKSGYDFHKIKVNDIQYIESDGDYVTFYTNGKKIMSHQTLKVLNESLNQSVFMRVHRSYIVNKSAVTGLKGRNLILSNEDKIPVSDSYYKQVKKDIFHD